MNTLAHGTPSRRKRIGNAWCCSVYEGVMLHVTYILSHVTCDIMVESCPYHLWKSHVTYILSHVKYCKWRSHVICHILEESCPCHVWKSHVTYILRQITYCIWRSRRIGNVLSMSSRKGKGYQFSAGLIAMVWCNNGIEGFHENLVTFLESKLPDFNVLKMRKYSS